MCNCNKSRKVLQNVIHMAERYEEVMEENVDVYEEAEQEFTFTPTPVDETKYDIRYEGKRKIYTLKNPSFIN